MLRYEAHVPSIIVYLLLCLVFVRGVLPVRPSSLYGGSSSPGLRPPPCSRFLLPLFFFFSPTEKTKLLPLVQLVDVGVNGERGN